MKKNSFCLAIDILDHKGAFKWMPDKLYLCFMFWVKMHKKIELNNPKTFNQKLQWLKIHNRKPEYTMLVDKYEVKKYISEIIGSQYVIPTIGIWDKFDEIDFNNLPSQFVLKCTHDSGGLVICKNKDNLDISAAKKKIEQSLRSNYYWTGREWPYKNVKPRIIAEKYMVDSKLHELRDYKFFCFNGTMRLFKVDFDRFSYHRANYYDSDCKLLDFGEAVCPPDPKKNIVLPKTINTMIQFAEQLAADIPFLRVDFYDVDGKIYFGEITFYPSSGFGKFIPEEWDMNLGKWLKLPSPKRTR